jgi:hypothetical protein
MPALCEGRERPGRIGGCEMSEFDFDDVIRTAKVIVNPEASAAELQRLRDGDYRLTQKLAQAQVKLEAKDALLLEMFQALAGVLGDYEHHGHITKIVLESCGNAVSHWLEMTQPEMRKE